MESILILYARDLLTRLRVLRHEEGQGLIEYALILALIAVVAIVALKFLGGKVTTVLTTIASSV
jgi:pilus assembly protein Flp/PilA